MLCSVAGGQESSQSVCLFQHLQDLGGTQGATGEGVDQDERDVDSEGGEER